VAAVPARVAQPAPAPARIPPSVRTALRYLLFGLACAGGWGLPIDPRVARYLLHGAPWTEQGE
jgi:hypothetical protein